MNTSGELLANGPIRRLISSIFSDIPSLIHVLLHVQKHAFLLRWFGMSIIHLSVLVINFPGTHFVLCKDPLLQWWKNFQRFTMTVVFVHWVLRLRYPALSKSSNLLTLYGWFGLPQTGDGAWALRESTGGDMIQSLSSSCCTEDGIGKPNGSMCECQVF